jgi:hypothetical protein
VPLPSLVRFTQIALDLPLYILLQIYLVISNFLTCGMWDAINVGLLFFLWDSKICEIYKYLYKAKPRAAWRPPASGCNLTIAGELFLVQALFIEHRFTCFSLVDPFFHTLTHIFNLFSTVGLFFITFSTINVFLRVSHW